MATPIFKSFQAKLVLFFCALFATVQLITISAVFDVSSRNVVSVVKQQLLYSGNTLNKYLQDRIEQHHETARVLTADFGFRAAIASEDAATIRSAINNLRGRVEADRIILYSLEHAVIADTRQNSADPLSLTLADFTAISDENEKAAGTISTDGRLHQYVVLPVLAPVPIAWIAVAFKVDDPFARNLQAILPQGLEVSFLERQFNNSWLALASTLNHEQQGNLNIHMGAAASSQEPVTGKLGTVDYISLVLPIKSAVGSKNVVASLQISLASAMAPYKSLQYWMICLSLAALFITLAGGVFIARSVTKPVRKLVAVANKIQQGDYSATLTLKQDDEIGRLADAFNHMVSSISEREDKIRYQMLHDVLTGLPNRISFDAHLCENIKRCKQDAGQFSVFLICVDRFSEINNTLGHEVGDRLIHLIGTRLKGIVKQADTTARLSSDSFIQLLTDTSPEQTRSIAARVLTEFEEPITIDEFHVDVDVHMGVACFPEHGDFARTLMQHAEVALEFSRESPRKYAIYCPERDPYTPERLSLMGELRHGLTRNEFELYAQPLIDMKTNQVSHVEFLARWNHPEWGFMVPDKFIPLAEQTGDIHRLTRWALDQAIQQISLWLHSGITISAAVNLSAKDLLNRSLPEYIAGLLDNHNVDPRWLHLEITESTIMQDPEFALDVMRDLNDMGLQLFIDDFGTGYSSMAYLKKLPVKALKIDKSFVIDLPRNREDEIIVRSTIDLARNLGMKVVAEGVEDQEALEILSAFGCDLTQGFYFSKPLPIHEFNQWMQTSPWGLSGPGDAIPLKA